MTPSRLVAGRMGRRAAAFSLAALAFGIPAVALRLLCVGGSCETTARASSYSPFCSLPDDVRSSVTESTRDGRTGELVMVAEDSDIGGGSVFSGKSSPQPRWPSLKGDAHRVPIAMAGAGVAEGASLPTGAGLDDVAPTLSHVIGFERTHPEVRSGKTLSEVVTRPARPPRLMIVVAWKGVGSATLSEDPGSFPNLEELLARGSGTLDGANGSYSSDPAGPLTTLGTGGTPSQHGITGSLLRNERGDLVTAWGPRSPVNVIATLGEDLDEALDQDPLVALVGTQEIDAGLIGGEWYVDNDRDLVSMLPEDSSPAALTAEAKRLLRMTALAKDETPDLLAVAFHGPLERLDQQLGGLWRAARAVAGDDFVLAVAGTGAMGPRPTGLRATELLRRLEDTVPGRSKVIEGVGPGEIFLDQQVLAEREISDEVVLDRLLEMRSPSGGPLFADVFPSVTVTFGRFC